MAITLQKAKVGMRDKISALFTDELRRNSYLLDKLPFDNAVAAGSAGSTLTYGYVKLKTPSVAEGRNIGSEYTGTEAEKEENTVTLKVLGGKYSIDRVIAQTGGEGFKNEVLFQNEQLAKAVGNRFGYLFINGNKTSDSKQFDGLGVLATANAVNGYLSTLTGAMTEGDAEIFCEALDLAISKCMRKPDVIFANAKTINRIKAAGRKAGYYSRIEDAFGKPVDAYDGIALVDLGKYYTVSEGTTTGTEVVADNVIWLACLGLDGVHGVSPISADAFISTRLPDYTEAGAVKDGDAEMVAAIVVKNDYAACKITLAAATTEHPAGVE